MPSLCQNPDFLYIFNFQLIILNNSASHFIEMTMLINLGRYSVSTQFKIRMEVGSITFCNMGPMRVQYVFMTISIFCVCSTFNISLGNLV